MVQTGIQMAKSYKLSNVISESIKAIQEPLNIHMHDKFAAMNDKV